MKIKIWLVFTFLCLTLTGCSANSEKEDIPQQQESIAHKETLPDTQSTEQVSTPVPSPYPETDFPVQEPAFSLDTPIREYGSSTAYIQMDDDLVIRILYPVSSISSLNEAMEIWVNDTVSYYQAESENCYLSGDCGELTAEYESYLINERFVSIIIRGIYDRPYLAHPVDIVATFHGDTQTGQILSLEDLLSQNGKPTLEQMVITDAGVDPAFADEHLLDHWLLTHTGLEIILGRGDYLPMSAGTVTLFYPYEALEGLLNTSLLTSVPAPPVTSDTPSEDAMPQVTPSSAPAPEVPSVEVLPIDPEKPMIALTFDDGPSKHTERLLDIFATHGGKGTFFVIGNILESRPTVLQRMVTEGHEIGGHSWDHRQLTKLNPTDLRNQITTTRDKIREITGLEATLLRPPYGSYNKDVKNACVELDTVMINWSLDTLDWKYKDADRIYETIMQEVSDGDIILCHDLHGATVDAMEKVIPQLLQEGYQLVTVSQLLDRRGDEIQAGEVYYKK